jgi:hypothetical protein
MDVSKETTSEQETRLRQIVDNLMGIEHVRRQQQRRDAGTAATG